jgi:hypothetical protein
MQLKRKANWRVVRDRIPCTRCCSAEHSTRECGKTKKEIETDRRSRERNPQDPINRANEVSVEPIVEYSVATVHHRRIV